MKINLDYLAEPNQRLIHKCDARFRVVCAGRKFGKALALNTPILTTEGWKTMGEIVVGDRVFDEGGNLTKVLGETEVFLNRPCYRITFSDKTEVIADAEHEWFTWTKWARKAYQRAKVPTIHPSVKTTKEIAKTIKVGLKKENNHSISVCEALKYPERKLSIAPYLLGIWLGDGTSRTAEITTGDEEIIEEIKRLGYEVKKKNNEKYTYQIYNFCHILRKLKLLQNKHIPIEYFSASEGQRLELVRGLMDSDGTVGKRGYCSFDNMNKRLVYQVQELLNGLGQKSSKYKRVARLYGKDCGICHRLYFAPSIRVFNLTRKIKRLKLGYTKRRDFRYIAKVEKIPSVPVKCIEVDSPSSLYLATKSLIPTHNSVCARKELVMQAIYYQPKKTGGVYQAPYFYIVCQTLKVGRDIHWRSLLAEIPNELIKRKGNRLCIDNTNLTIELVNGAIIKILGAENADRMRGPGVVGMVVDQAAYLPRMVWEEVLKPELFSTKGWALFISTPKGYNWFHDLWKRGQDDKKKDWKSFRFTTYDTPRAKDPDRAAELADEQQNSAPETFAQEYLADFTMLKGLIYKEFNSKVHIIEPFEIPKDIVAYRAIDWGTKNPLAVLFFAPLPDGSFVLYDEIYETEITMADLADKIRAKSYNRPFGNTYADPSGKQWILDLDMTHKIPTEKALRESSTTKSSWVNLGIDKVREKMIARLPDGKPVFKVFNTCTSFLKEIALYSWKEMPKKVSEVNHPGVPENANDHCFVGETMILTKDGWKRIDEIRKGEYVWSPFGWNKVYRAGFTGRKKVKDYGVFKCTPGHKILTSNGLREVDKLRYSDKIMVWLKARPYTFKEFLIGVIQMPRTALTGFILGGLLIKGLEAGRDFCTEMYGNSIKVKFLKVIWFIMLTVMLRITTLIILSFSLIANMLKSIIGVFGMEWKNISIKLGSLLNLGMPVKKEEKSTEELAERLGKQRNGFLRTVLCATKGTRLPFLAGANTVISTAKPQPLEEEGVFNLATKFGCYFANGVLVSNCMDAMRYFFVSYKPTTFDDIDLPDDTEKFGEGGFY